MIGLAQEQTAGGHQVSLLVQGRKAECDQVGIHEYFAMSNLGQVLERKGGLARAIRAGDDPANRLGVRSHTRRILPVSSSCIMPCLMSRVLSRRASSAAISASMVERMVAMAVCS
jgi:hypothetical protein